MVLNEGARACGCGWKDPSYKAPGYPLGYRQCDARHGALRCKYPGNISSDTKGGGPWQCSPHFEAEAGSTFAAELVIASQDYVHSPVKVRLLTEAKSEAAAFCEERGLNSRQKMVEFMRKEGAKIGTKTGGLDWAHKIMARIQAGESLPMISEEKARTALGLPSIAEAARDKRTDRDALEAQFPAMQALR